MYYTRNITSKLTAALSRSPVVLLTGARQTGKTTLMKEICKEYGEYTYVTFDDISYLSAAKKDPMGFISGLKKPVILDEVQRVPELFLAIKYEVDNNRKPGLFALTGSANPLLIPSLSDSLAGRMEIIEMLPLSQGELLGIREQFISAVFQDGPIHFDQKTPTKEALFDKIIIGGFPPVQPHKKQRLDYNDLSAWFNGYVTTVLQRDARDLAQIAGIRELPSLLKLLATRASSLLNVAELSRTSAIPATTLNRYFTLLETLYLTRTLPPWSNNRSKRLVKSPKLFLVDYGLLCFLLNLNEQGLKNQGPLLGSIFENMVFDELTKQITWHDRPIGLYHYRTSMGMEVDFILENYDGSLVGIEVKTAKTVTPADTKGLRYLQEQYPKIFKRGVVLYGGTDFIPFSKDVCALPMSALWQLTTD